MKNIFKSILVVVVTLLITTSIVSAIGTLTPAGTAGDDTQYTLNDIYTRLTTGATTTVGTGTMTVPGTVSASFRTLTEIYEAVPTWLTLSDATTTVSAGYYEATDLASVDTDLIAGNIKSGTTIFGVEGNVSAGNNVELHSKQARCWNTANTEVACGSADGNTIYQDARLDGNVASFTDLTTGTVKDNFTGLIWQKDSSDKMTWYDALGYCAALANGIGGVTDGSVAGTWRLPSYAEIATFPDINCSEASANCSGQYLNIAFTAPSGWGNCMGGYCGYWSSTTPPTERSCAYTLGSFRGTIDCYGLADAAKGDNYAYGAKCVRSGN